MKVQSHSVAIIEGLLVTIIWASSFVFVKMALAYMGPLTIAGLRYFIGFLILLPFLAPRLRGLRGLPCHAYSTTCKSLNRSKLR